MDKQLFRQKSLDHISSPEELHDYMRVTSPRLWMILTAIVLLLGGFIIYAATARMESTETIRLRVDRGSIMGYIPEGRQDLIKVGMPVRIAGKTGKINYTDNSIQYYLKVALDSGEPMERGYYLMTFGDDGEIKIDDDGAFSVPVVFGEYNGNAFIMPSYTETSILRRLESGDVRVCFWTETDGNGDETIKLERGRLGTASGYAATISVLATVMLDDPDAEIPDGEYDAVIVTENTTPISFLWN